MYLELETCTCLKPIDIVSCVKVVAEMMVRVVVAVFGHVGVVGVVVVGGGEVASDGCGCGHSCCGRCHSCCGGKRT